jgi:plastocyanin
MTSKRLVAVLLVVVFAALGAGCGGDDDDNDNEAATDTTTQPAEPAGGKATTVSMTEYEFDPGDLTVERDSSVTVENDGNIAHNLTVEKGGKKVAGTSSFLSGKSEKLSVDLAPGKYEMVCTVPGHEELGMKGTFTVK